MQKKRPVFLDLLEIRLPVMALTSIFHRLSGVVLVLSLPLLVYLFDLSLRDDAGFSQVAAMLRQTEIKLLLTLLAFAISHHLLAGIRHLLIDLDIGVKRRHAIRSAWLVNLVGLLVAVVLVMGVWSCTG